MRIGLLGGTFDPPHKGHLELARTAKEQLQLDEVLFVPANRNPVKGLKRTPGKMRLEMLALALEGEPGVGILDSEITKGGLSYTVDTISELAYVQPGEYWFLMGGDTLRGFPAWKQPQRILKMARLGVVLRGGEGIDDLLVRMPPGYEDHIDWIEMPRTDISASELRHRIEKGQSTGSWIKPEVLKYIEQNKLYRS